MVSSLFYETNMFGANKHNKLTNMVQYDILSTEQSQDQAKATTVATARDEVLFRKTYVKDAGDQG